MARARSRRGASRRGPGAGALAAGALLAVLACFLGGAAADCAKGKKACKRDTNCYWGGSTCSAAANACEGVQGKKMRKKCRNTRAADGSQCACSNSRKKCGQCQTSSSTGPSGPPFLPDDVMKVTGGAIEFKPSESNGPWTDLCRVAVQARAMAGLDLKKEDGFQRAKEIWESYGSINNPDYSGTPYFDKNVAFHGGKKDFLRNYFMTAVLGSKPGGCGTDDFDARAQIIKKVSQDWVPVTHIMYRLDKIDADLSGSQGPPSGRPTGTSRQGTDAHKRHFDEVAALWFGCGEGNPGKGMPDALDWGRLEPDESKGDKRTDTFGAPKYAVSGRADARAMNYDKMRDVVVQGGRKKRETALLNFNVHRALEDGPDQRTIRVIKDAIFTVYSQATLRYTSKMTLKAKLPGNGMGGAPGGGACGGSGKPCCDTSTSSCTRLHAGELAAAPGKVSVFCDEGTAKDEDPKNPSPKDLLEGQVFFQVIAGMMADMSDPRVPPNPIHDESLAQLTLCANNINTMFTWNPEGDGAVVFPSWKVHIGAYGNVGSYLAPNGFCYVNACLDEFVSHATSGGGMHMGLLVSSPNMGRPKGDKGCGRAYAACLAAPTRTPPQCQMPACGWDGKEWTQATRPGPPSNKPAGD